MSRTAKDMPARLRDNYVVEDIHRGCELDPTGRGRRHVTVETIEHPAHWHDTVLPCRQCVEDECTDPSHARTTEAVFGPWSETIEHVAYEVVECDIEDGKPGGCIRLAWPEYGPRFWTSVPRKWTRDFYYRPERAEVRAGLHALMMAYNSGTDVNDMDDPWSPASPSGLHGGGWID